MSRLPLLGLVLLVGSVAISGFGMLLAGTLKGDRQPNRVDSVFYIALNLHSNIIILMGVITIPV